MTITVTIEGQPWDDPAAPWTPTTHTFSSAGRWNAMDALHMIAAAHDALNVRLVAWQADTEAEREEMRRMLGARPYLHYALDQAAPAVAEEPSI